MDMKRERDFMDLISALNSIGKRAFVKYYFDFKNKSIDACLASFEENYTHQGKYTRVVNAKRIFRENLQIQALEIISGADRVDEGTKTKAKTLLSLERSTI